jgi:hemerythrin
MIIQWTKDLAVGVSAIDNQHKELFKRINKMIRTMTHSNARAEISKVMIYLESYALSHFAMEEAYMSKHEFPGFQSHKTQHEEFVETYHHFKKAYDEKQRTSHLAMKFQSWLCDWWINHIARMDKKLGSYLKGKI